MPSLAFFLQSLLAVPLRSTVQRVAGILRFPIRNLPDAFALQLIVVSMADMARSETN